jgi:hypothetical protein
MHKIVFVQQGYMLTQLPFNKDLNNSLKMMKYRRWIPKAKAWLFNRAHYDQLVSILAEHNIEFNTYSTYVEIDNDNYGVVINDNYALAEMLKIHAEVKWDNEKYLYTFPKRMLDTVLLFFAKFGLKRPLKIGNFDYKTGLDKNQDSSIQSEFDMITDFLSQKGC